MVQHTSFMGLGGPNLVKGATGQIIDSEPLGGAHLHTATSGVAHYMAKDDQDCLTQIRSQPPAGPPPTLYGNLVSSQVRKECAT